MVNTEPVGTLHAGFSSPGATAASWSDVRERLAAAEVFWISTVRPDGRPHVTPLIAVWRDEALYFCTGGAERKARNLAENPRCTLTTGCNRMDEGVDLVVDGQAVRVSEDDLLHRIARDYAAKYGWNFVVRGDEFVGEGGNVAQVYRMTPATVYAYGRDGEHSATSWRF
ncbi:putative pyridoxamine 5'-phosphate oxidase family protein [Actinoalloteichus hoggarensis]|uniref:Pyridoxamine 5'-phosphate oxidase n=1 Tax=Actinoalloteichus hoggarensis TaxID=1470176 RepID=A0A221W3I7_9PSEU|nr:pyridoxamine 5'-phosphate oxidase family protein [Actinoalloteichus hoggarensis]ASO20430.1 Pyridoxamine 5'-phosphate oxidase [Actinoalloteichus hoggarensis]MBB5923469.1 putative pyridoxamine 5'-phosphate oxidase family protein [Actinoalloteichus hoggarensis]